jgi:hypothetical protein
MELFLGKGITLSWRLCGCWLGLKLANYRHEKVDL